MGIDLTLYPVDEESHDTWTTREGWMLLRNYWSFAHIGPWFKDETWEKGTPQPELLVDAQKLPEGVKLHINGTTHWTHGDYHDDETRVNSPYGDRLEFCTVRELRQVYQRLPKEHLNRPLLEKVLRGRTMNEKVVLYWH